MGDSLVRELPFSHVKSANAKGSAFPGLAAPDLPFSVACGPTAAPRSLEGDSGFADVAPGAILGVAAAAMDVGALTAPGGGADGCGARTSSCVASGSAAAA